MKDDILWYWQQTDMSAEQIARIKRTTRSVVLGIVHRAREKGDIRATRRSLSATDRRRIRELEAEIARIKGVAA